MPAYLITGSSGAGKTSIAEELRHRGYTAYDDASVPGLNAHFDLSTGKKMVANPPAPIDYHRYAYNWDIPLLKKLLKSDDLVFVSGITSNTLENLDLFDGIFVPHPSLSELERRIVTRTNNDFGKHPKELAQILKDHVGGDDFWRGKGAIIIDGDQPLAKVVDDILGHVRHDHQKSA